MPDRPHLSRELVLSAAYQRRRDLRPPAPETFRLPETVVQFGTGNFLRGFADFFLDHANHHGHPSGRVVVVGSTGSGRTQAFNTQDGLYTLHIQGLAGGEAVEETRVVSSVSRALAASSDWKQVLELAESPDLRVVLSNTTEVGIADDPSDRVEATPPASFPAKLTAFLARRAERFGYASGSGLVVIPCELIERNGDTLRELVLTWGERSGLGTSFAQWIKTACAFPNTLVDRIVPGAPPPESADALNERLAYTDDLLVTSEVYALWAIEGGDELERRIGFAGAHPGVVVTPHVEPYRLRKVRLLNGTHTLLVPVALGCGLETVREAMEDERVGAFVRRVMDDELVPATAAELRSVQGDPDTALPFARDVRDRFANPFIRHELTRITLQQTLKLDVRVMPAASSYGRLDRGMPRGIALGMACLLLLHRHATSHSGERLFRLDPSRLLQDDHAPTLRRCWDDTGATPPRGILASVVHRALSSDAFTTDVTHLDGFSNAVLDALETAIADGIPAAVDAYLASERPAP